LRAQAFGGFAPHQFRLPGLVADALPDGWGLMLMDRLFRQRGLAPGPLDRLAMMGDRAMGALRFEPVDGAAWAAVDMPLLALAQASAQLLDGEAAPTLLALAVTGGSPQGARPKALVQYDRATGQVSTLPQAAGEPWLVKFQAQGEHKEVCAIEQLYAQMARACGLEMPETVHFDLSADRAGFGVARFDREGALRVPVHSLAGLLHADFRLPSVDYTTFLRATRLMTRDEQEVEKAFARAVFNVVFHNCDDHAKNFAWRLGRDRRWRLAPAFDLTFSAGPGGEHQSDVCGEGRRITRGHLRQLAHDGGVDAAFAASVVEAMAEQAGHVAQAAQLHPIRRRTVQAMVSQIEANRAALG
jgi:serine/threonine-protein kinase HipA